MRDVIDRYVHACRVDTQPAIGWIGGVHAEMLFADPEDGTVLKRLSFFIAAKNYKSETDIRPFAKKLIEKELEISRTLEQIHFDNRKFDYYRTDIIFGKFGDR